MMRLLENHFNDFYNKTMEFNIEHSLDQLRFPDGYTSTVNAKDEIKVLKYGYYKKKYTIPVKDFKKISKEDLEKYGYGLLFFTVHPGAIFTETKNVVSLGGYFEGFKGWGYDDVDLQIRLLKFTKKRARSMPGTAAFKVLHLDHKTNFNKESYVVNEAQFLDRTKLELKELVTIDRKENKF